MWRLTVNRMLMYCYQPVIWFYGLVYLLIQSFVFNLLLQPTVVLSISHKMGVFWAIMVFSNFTLIGQVLTRRRLIWLVEAQQALAFSGRIWFSDFVAFWIVYAAMTLFALPVMGLLYGLSWHLTLYLYLIWCISSPVFLLQMYLARCLSFFMRNGIILSLCCLIPWVIPGLLMTIQCLDQRVMTEGYAQALSLLLGGNMVFGAAAFYVIDRMLPRCYHYLNLK